MNTTTISSDLLASPFQLNISFGSFLWTAGNLGCIGNIIVFGSKSFRHRAYSIYLLVQAMSDFLYFDFVLLTRILQKGYQIPIIARYNAICKIRQFSSFWCNQVSFTLFSLATVDRLLSAQRSIKYRRWSNRASLSYKLSVASLIFWFLIIGHRLVLYSANNGKCNAASGFYADFDNYLEVVLVAICPPIVTAAIAYLLIRSVRDVIHRRVVPANDVPQTTIVHRSVLQQMDAQLTLMLILQSVISVTTYIPYAGELIYSNVTQYWPKSSLRKAQEKVFVELIHLVSYVFFASGFYVSMISNRGFRREIKRFFIGRKERTLDGGTQTALRMNVGAITQPR